MLFLSCIKFLIMWSTTLSLLFYSLFATKNILKHSTNWTVDDLQNSQMFVVASADLDS